MCEAEAAAKAGANSYHIYGQSGWQQLNKQTLQIGGRDVRLMAVQKDQLVLLEPEVAVRVLSSGEGLQYLPEQTSRRETTAVYRTKKKKKSKGITKGLAPLLQELNSHVGLLTKMLMRQWIGNSNTTITEIPERQKIISPDHPNSKSLVVAAEVHVKPLKKGTESNELTNVRQATSELDTNEGRRKRKKETKIYCELSDECLTDSSMADQVIMETSENAPAKRKIHALKHVSKRYKSSQAVSSNTESSDNSRTKSHKMVQKKNNNKRQLASKKLKKNNENYSSNNNNETDSSLEFVDRSVNKCTVQFRSPYKKLKSSIMQPSASDDTSGITYKVPSSQFISRRYKNLETAIQDAIEAATDSETSKKNDKKNQHTTNDTSAKTQRKAVKKNDKEKVKKSHNANYGKKNNYTDYSDSASSNESPNEPPKKRQTRCSIKNKENINVDNETDSSLDFVEKPARKCTFNLNSPSKELKSSILQKPSACNGKTYKVPSSPFTSPRRKSLEKPVQDVIEEESDSETGQKNDSKKNRHDSTQGANSSGYSHVKNRVYSMQEDRIILDFVMIQENHKLVKGTLMWKEMQKTFYALANQARTWQSLKNRYLKYILPNLQYYGLPYDKERVLRVGAYVGEMKKKGPKENSIFKIQPVVSASNVLRKKERQVAKTQNQESQPSTSQPDKPTQTANQTQKSVNALRSERKPESSGPTSSTPKHSPTKKPSPTYSELTRRYLRRAQALDSSNDSGANREIRSPIKTGTRKLYTARI